MGVLTPFRSEDRADTRVIIFYRADPVAARRLLPQGHEARILAGKAILATHYSRARGARRWLPGVVSNLDRLAYRIAVERDHAGAPGWWTGGTAVSESGWLRRRVIRFQLEDGAFRIELAVQQGGQEELYLRAEPTALLEHSVFTSARQVEEFLAHGDSLPDPVALHAEILDVLEHRSAFFDDPARFPPQAVELDSAFRLVRRRADRAFVRAHEARTLPGNTSAAVPTS